MNRLIITGLLLIYCFTFGITDSLNISVKVTEFKSNLGKARVLVFKNDNGFPSDQSKAIFSLMSDIKDLTAKFDMKLIPGEYAISIHHDENNNDEVDTTWYGRPTEGFGASKDPVSRFGPPDFEDCSIFFKNSNTITIKMKYF